MKIVEFLEIAWIEFSNDPSIPMIVDKKITNI